MARKPPLRLPKATRRWPKWTSWARQSPSALIIALLSWLVYYLAQHLEPAPSPLPLPSSHQPVELYSNQTRDPLTRLFVEAIESAQESITLAIYALTDQQVIQALHRKSAAGIPVYIVADAKASPGLSRQLPQATVIRRFSEGLMHQKILIIDHRQVWMGSANLTPSSLEIHGNLVSGIDHPALAHALTARIKSMDEDGGVSAPLKRLKTAAGSQQLELWVLPDDPEGAKRMAALLRSAQKSIKVAMFTWTRTDFASELRAAAQRGVEVSVILDRYSANGASAKIVQMLSKGGISVRLSTGPGLLHHKFAYIDDTLLINGSANWTNAAFKTNDDAFLVIYPLTPEQKTKMQRLWSMLQKQSTTPQAASKEPARSFTEEDL